MRLSTTRLFFWQLARCSLPVCQCQQLKVSLNRRDGEDLDSQGDGSSQPDTISIASRTSQNTVDSDKVGQCPRFLPPTLLLGLTAPRELLSKEVLRLWSHDTGASGLFRAATEKKNKWRESVWPLLAGELNASGKGQG